MEEQLLALLAEITGSDEVIENRGVHLFNEGLLDSLGTVELLVELEGTFGVQVPISEFNRELWDTPNKIIEQVKLLQV
jgi:D-alanine--poly(phosphoribitol) ligase subunit 2